MTFTSRDKIALLVASTLGVAFLYLVKLAGYPAAVLLFMVYAMGIIPLVVGGLADQRKLLVWQVGVLSFVLSAVVAGFLWGPIGPIPKEALKAACFFWIVGSVLSSPLPLLIYWERLRKRKYKWVRFYLIGAVILASVFPWDYDPLLVFALELVWILFWLVKSARDWRSASNQNSHLSRNSTLLALVAFVLVASTPVWAVLFFKQQTFHSAVDHGHYLVAKCLVLVGANVNGPDALGHTALAVAAWNGDINTVKVLISMGADVNQEQRAEFQGLFPSGTALAVAAAAGRPEICKFLLDSGADVNKKNQHGMTPFSVALSDGTIQCASAMLDFGPDVNSRNALGETPLMLLQHCDPNDVVVHHVLDLLLDKGADVTAKDDKGQTAEDWALLYHRQEVADRLQRIRESTAKEQ